MFRLPALKAGLPARADSAAVTRGRSDVEAVIGAFESETAAVFARTAPGNEHMILYVLAGMLVFVIVFMSVTKLDRVVTGVGRILPAQGSIYIQSLNQTIIKDIRVRVGDVVHKGQVLATLDPTFANATYVETLKHYGSDVAQEQREAAEVADRPYVPAGNGAYDQLQLSIWNQRQAEYKASVANFDAQIAASAAIIAQLAKDAQQYSERLKLASEAEGMDQKLEQSGWGSRLKTILSTDARVEMTRLMADSQNQLASNRQTMASLKDQRAAYIEKWHSDTGNDLVTVRNDLDKTREDLRSARELKDLTAITAPGDAVVVKIGKASSGSVTGPSLDPTVQDPLFTLVPLGGPLVADVDIETLDEGFLKAGQPVRIKLDAYRFLQYGTADGVLDTVTESSFKVDEDTNQPTDPYVKARIRITGVHLRHLPSNFRLIPGMTIQADVLVGRRSIISYLVEGVLRTTSEAMREP